MFNWLRKAWQALDGNKTKIGAVIILAAKGLRIWNAPEPLILGLEQTGELIATLGLAHGVTKSLDKPVPPTS